MIYGAIAKDIASFDPGKNYKITFVNTLYWKYCNNP